MKASGLIRSFIDELPESTNEIDKAGKVGLETAYRLALIAERACEICVHYQDGKCDSAIECYNGEAEHDRWEVKL